MPDQETGGTDRNDDGPEAPYGPRWTAAEARCDRCGGPLEPRTADTGYGSRRAFGFCPRDGWGRPLTYGSGGQVGWPGEQS